MVYSKEKKIVHEVPLIEYKHVGAKPTIFFIHGINRDKDYVEDYVLEFVEKGYNVISIDAYLHGDRKIDISKEELELKYPDIVIKTGNDVKKLYEHYIQLPFVDKDNIFIMGISMGGAIAVYTSTILDVKGYVSFIGSPSLVSFLEYSSGLKGVEFLDSDKERLSRFDPTLNVDKLVNKNILLLNGTKDVRVPANYSIDLSQNIDSIDLRLYNTCHKVNSEMIEDVYEWLKVTTL